MKPALLFCSLILFYNSFCQDTNYWQQQVNFQISVNLKDDDHTLDGFLKMEYINNSPDTLQFIWIHLWPNAYKNDRTAYTDQALENESTEFYFSPENKKGYINRLEFKVDDILATIEDHAQHQDIIKLLLPAPLLPGNKINIETPFHVKLPFNFSRGGHIGQSYQLTQWYPKPAVYDHKGWHPIPYLDQGEFYNDFGNYKVSITVPEEYVVASTGIQTNTVTEGDSKTLTFEQENIHDFAWFADKDYILAKDTLQLATKIIEVRAYYLPSKKETWNNSLQFIKNAITSKSKWIGEYPYNIVSVVEKPGRNSGGMEYPTITLLSSPGNERQLDLLIHHEVGHNWFYGILASNERSHPWMDEGMNSYYDKRYGLQQYSNTPVLNEENKFFGKRIPTDLEAVLLRAVVKEKKDQPIETTSEKFTALNYSLIAYTKAAQWMQLLENEMGTLAFDKMMHIYYERCKFKHPYPADFKAIVEEVHGRNIDSLFGLLEKKEGDKKYAKKDFKLMPFFSLKDTDKYNHIFISPAAGYNFYDKFMIGGLIHNYTLPQNQLQFIIAPLYATGSKKLNGIGKISYKAIWKKGNKLVIALNGAKFSGTVFKDSTNTSNFLDYKKLVPALTYTFANKDPRSSISKFIQWKSYLLNERSYLFTRDTINQNFIITYPSNKKYIHQVNFGIENNRKLYPYNAILQGEKGAGFFKINLSSNYYFNYARGGGLNVRLFAGKFFYSSDLTSSFKTYQYHFNMTGANGFEDYTYSNYFIGRNEFDGLLSQQIMIKDGGFKVRTDLLSNKFGRSDDWLSAVNFTSSIPKTIFPLPLKIFADIGTYAEAWDKDAPTGKFVYDAGVQLSLLKNIINIYIPLVYSKVYRDYFKSYIPEKRFQKNISFSIDVQNISLKKFFPQSPF
ncbi:MAG: M1 family metallopeptidase [Ferruginibacter sp.]